MKTAAYVLQEEQIEWLKHKAREAGQSTISAALRRVLREAMERDGVVLSMMKSNDDSTTILPLNTK